MALITAPTGFAFKHVPPTTLLTVQAPTPTMLITVQENALKSAIVLLSPILMKLSKNV